MDCNCNCKQELLEIRQEIGKLHDYADHSEHREEELGAYIRSVEERIANVLEDLAHRVVELENK